MTMNKCVFDDIQIDIRIPQASLLSLNLYLFHIVDFISLCFITNEKFTHFDFTTNIFYLKSASASQKTPNY